MSHAHEKRLQRLEQAVQSRDALPSVFFQTVAPEGDDAEHDRQLAEQKAAKGLKEGEDYLHVRISLVSPPNRDAEIARHRAQVDAAAAGRLASPPALEPASEPVDEARVAEMAAQIAEQRKAARRPWSAGIPLPRPPGR